MALPFCPQPKPEARKRVKARKRRRERRVTRSIRAIVSERDGYCRYFKDMVARGQWGHAFCWGYSEWAHFGAQRRARTRGQAPEARHTTHGTVMLCTKHHADYDHGRLTIRARTKQGCDGPLSYRKVA